MTETKISFQDFFENTSIASLLIGLDGKVVSANRAACDFLNLEMDIIGKSLDDFLVSDSGSTFSQRLKVVRDIKARQAKVDCKLKASKEAPAWYRAEISFLGDQFTFQLVDVTRERAQEERLDRINRASLTGMWEVNHITQESWTSHLFDDITSKKWRSVERNPEEGEKHWFERIHPDDVQAAMTAWSDHVEKDVPYSVVCRYQSEPGKFIWIEIKGSSDRDEKGKALFTSGSLRDITDESVYKSKLEEMNAELESFAYLASHDLQAPLRHVMMYVDMLKLELGDVQLNAEAEKAMATIQSSTHRMKRLIDDLLNYSKAGELKSSMQNVDVGRLLSNVREVLKPQVEETGAEIQFGEMPEIFGDGDRLNLLFTNLIGNALKYANPDRSPKVEISCEDVTGLYHFRVKDNGLGIPEESLEAVFEIFKRLHNKDKVDGTGLGLAICRKVVDLHAGKIWISNSSPEGTEFSFTISKNLDKAKAS